MKAMVQEHIQADVPGIVLLSHGPLATGLLGSMRLVYGDAPNIAAFELEEGDDPDEFRARFTEVYEAFPTGSTFLIDVFGGTPFNQVMHYCLERKVEIRAVCGVNLGMLIEAVALRGLSVGSASSNISGVGSSGANASDQPDFLDQLEEIGKTAVVNVGRKWRESGAGA